MILTYGLDFLEKAQVLIRNSGKIELAYFGGGGGGDNRGLVRYRKSHKTLRLIFLPH